MKSITGNLSLAVAAVLCGVVAIPVFADEAVVPADLGAAFANIATHFDAATAAKLGDDLSSSEVSGQAWQKFFTSFFSTRRFSPSLMQFWNYAILRKSDMDERLVLISGYCAMQAFAADVLSRRQNLGDGDAPMLNALVWLQQIAPRLTAAERLNVLSGMADTLKGQALDLNPLLAQSTAVSVSRARLGMQICLTLWSYSASGTDSAPFDAVVRVPVRISAFMQSTGIFLFDNLALSPQQVSALESVVHSIPKELHRVDALLVPQAYGINPIDAGVVTQGQLVLISLPSARESANSPTSAEFTISAAVSLMRAVQEVQFERRPYLTARLDALLEHHADARALYGEQPLVLLPMTSERWFMDTEYAFRTALDAMAAGDDGPMETLMLIADVLSGGGPTTPAFSTASDGIMTGRLTPVDHLPIFWPPTDVTGVRTVVGPIDGIVVAGQLYSFMMDEMGDISPRKD
jgi:hypothetical protein